MAIVTNLASLMKEKNLRGNQLAAAIGITPVNLSRIKTGKISAVRFSTLNALCRELDCTPGDIFSYEPDDDSLDTTYDVQYINDLFDDLQRQA